MKLQALDNISITTYAHLDSGSQSTLVRADVVSKLKLKTKDKNVVISTINNSGAATKTKEKSLRVENKEDGTVLNIAHSYIVEKSSFHMPKQQYQTTIIKKIKDKLGITLRCYDIGILIGANAPLVHIPLDGSQLKTRIH